MGMPTHYVPPSGFCYPLDGLLPLYPVPVLFRTGGALGIRPSEFSPCRRYPMCYHSKEPTYRSIYRCSHYCIAVTSQPDKLRFLGFNPSASPWQSVECLVRRLLVTPLGFTLLGLGTDLFLFIKTRSSPGYAFTSHCVVHHCRLTNDL